MSLFFLQVGITIHYANSLFAYIRLMVSVVLFYYIDWHWNIKILW